MKLEDQEENRGSDEDTGYLVARKDKVKSETINGRIAYLCTLEIDSSLNKHDLLYKLGLEMDRQQSKCLLMMKKKFTIVSAYFLGYTFYSRYF